jgi:hypothetical protein
MLEEILIVCLFFMFILKIIQFISDKYITKLKYKKI